MKIFGLFIIEDIHPTDRNRTRICRFTQDQFFQFTRKSKQFTNLRIGFICLNHFGKNRICRIYNFFKTMFIFLGKDLWDMQCTCVHVSTQVQLAFLNGFGYTQCALLRFHRMHQDSFLIRFFYRKIGYQTFCINQFLQWKKIGFFFFRQTFFGIRNHFFQQIENWLSIHDRIITIFTQCFFRL